MFTRVNTDVKYAPTRNFPLRFGFETIGLEDVKEKFLTLLRNNNLEEVCFGKTDDKQMPKGLLNISVLDDDDVRRMELWQGAGKEDPIYGLYAPQTVVEFLQWLVRLVIHVFAGKYVLNTATVRSQLGEFKRKSSPTTFRKFYTEVLRNRPNAFVVLNAFIVCKSFGLLAIKNCAFMDKHLRSVSVLCGRLLRVTHYNMINLLKLDICDEPLNLSFERGDDANHQENLGDRFDEDFIEKLNEFKY